MLLIVCCSPSDCAHDVLGYTLSLIALKTGLAGLSQNSDAERARAEMADVENVSRRALVEVQQTLLGDRSETEPPRVEWTLLREQQRLQSVC